MFDRLSTADKRKAKIDFEQAKIIHEFMTSAGKSEDEIKTKINEKFAGKAWLDEIIQVIFNAYEYKRQEQRRRNQERYERESNRREEQHRQWREQWSGYNRTSSPPPPQGISLNEALQFFGFTTLPDKTELKRQYLMLALKLHPDKGGDTAIFQKFQNYKEILWRRAGL